MKSANAVWIGAIVIAIAAIAFAEFGRDGVMKQPSADQQVTTASDAGNQQNDPYKQKRALAMTAVRDAYFAVGCEIFASDAEILPLVSYELSVLKDEAQASGSTDAKLDEELNAAGQDGTTRAQRTGECDYWRDHPDAVFAVRKAVREAAEP